MSAPICTWPSCKCTARDQCKGSGVRADLCDPTQDERVRALVDAAERLADLWDKDATDRIGPATRQLRAALRDMKGGE